MRLELENHVEEDWTWSTFMVHGHCGDASAARYLVGGAGLRVRVWSVPGARHHVLIAEEVESGEGISSRRPGRHGSSTKPGLARRLDACHGAVDEHVERRLLQALQRGLAVEDKFIQSIARASQGRLDADALERYERLQDLPDIVVETVRRLETRISAVRLIKYSVAGVSLGEISRFLEELLSDERFRASDWRRHPEVYARADLDLLARGELPHIVGALGEVASSWRVRESNSLFWRLGDENGGAPFKVAYGEDESWSAPGRLLRATPRSLEPARELAVHEVGEAMARWVVSLIARHLELSQRYESTTHILATLRATAHLAPGTEPSRFFVACCALTVRELEVCQRAPKGNASGAAKGNATSA